MGLWHGLAQGLREFYPTRQALRRKDLHHPNRITQHPTEALSSMTPSQNALLQQIKNDVGSFFETAHPQAKQCLGANTQNGEQLIGFHVNRGEDRAADFYVGSRFLKDLYQPKLIKRAYEFGREDFAISEYEQKSGLTLMKISELLDP